LKTCKDWKKKEHVIGSKESILVYLLLLCVSYEPVDNRSKKSNACHRT
jgi:hypothetical protein